MAREFTSRNAQHFTVEDSEIKSTISLPADFLSEYTFMDFCFWLDEDGTVCYSESGKTLRSKTKIKEGQPFTVKLRRKFWLFGPMVMTVKRGKP